MKQNSFFITLVIAFVLSTAALGANRESNPASLLDAVTNMRASQSNNNTGSIENQGAVPEETQAEKLRGLEQDFQQRLTNLTQAVDSLSQRLNELRKQAVAPSQEDVDRLSRELSLAIQEGDGLAATAVTPLAQLQRSELQDKLFDLQVAMDIMKRRWGSGQTVFGLDFFQNSNIFQTNNPIPAPKNYKIRAGDTLDILITSALGAQNEYHPTVAANGTVQVSGAGKIKASGKTPEQIENTLKSKVTSRFKQLKVQVTVEKMSTIQVQVAGEVTRPGTYTLTGMPTVFAALYQAGGPTKSGTLRHISLVRDGEPKRNIDLYDFLLKGNKTCDLPLEDGDLIFISPIGPTITVAGEVIRSGRYEPSFPVTLGEVLSIAGGAKSSSYLQTVQVERVENSEYKVLISEPLKGAIDKSKFSVKPGDEITVLSIRPDRTNQVSVSGPVNAPGMYGFKEGMKITDLISLAQGLVQDREVYGGRADILRIDPLKGTEIMTVNLDKALQGNEAENISLTKLDRLFVYEPDQVVFRPKLITLSGAVAKPGTYKRAGGMKVSDAIAAGGGIMPQAYLKHADLIRYKDDETTELIQINIQNALSGISSDNIQLQDRDKLTVYSQNEVQWQNHTTRIEGAVQRPGVYERSENMRVSDLLFMAGGPLPEAASELELAHCDKDGATASGKISLSTLETGSKLDLLLQDGDVVTVPSANQYLHSPDVVYITGEVNNPGPYALKSKSERLSELIDRAGGLTEAADRNGILFLRQKENFQNNQQEQDVDIILAKSRLFSDKQFLVQLAKMGVMLPDKYMQTVNQAVTRVSKPANVVADEKLEQTTVGDATTTTKLAAIAEEENKTLVQQAVTSQPDGIDTTSAMGPAIPGPVGDLLPAFKGRQEIGEITDSARISVHLDKALTDRKSPDDLTLRDGDRILIPQVTDVVTVVGAVLHPHSFAAGPGKNADYYIERSGGFAQDASPKHVVVVKANGDALPKNKIRSLEPGDTVVVPTSGLIDVAKHYEKAGQVSKVISDILSSVFILTRF